MQDRKKERHAISLTCRVRSKAGHAEKVIILPQRGTIRDLSITGCAIRSPRLSPRREDHVLLGIGDVDPIEADVRWVREGEAVGIRFLQSLNSTQMDGIAQAAKQSSRKRTKAYLSLQVANSELRAVC